MNEAAKPDGQDNNQPNVSIAIQKPVKRADWATILGLIFAVTFIGVAIYLGQSEANFFNLPSFLIVILGTIAATSISYTGEEITKAGRIIGKSIIGEKYDVQNLTSALIGLSVVARKHGVLALSSYSDQMQKTPHLHKVMQMVIDGFQPKDIEKLLKKEVESLIERHKRSASITRRASEVAPAMGLIGTLVGLVQMLAELENPEAIGPAMAVALLTTFYGAILGTVIMAPLAIKLEKNSSDEALIKTLIAVTAISIANQDNPRHLEMLLNSELPPKFQINYFDQD